MQFCYKEFVLPGSEQGNRVDCYLKIGTGIQPVGIKGYSIMIKDWLRIGYGVYVGCLCLLLLCSCKSEKISSGALPESSRAFLSLYYPDERIVHSEEVDGEPRYIVLLENMVEIRFYRSGEWQKMEAHQGALSDEVLYSVLPSGILTYVATRYSGAGFVWVEIRDWGYELEITDPAIVLRFSPEGDWMPELSYLRR